MTEGRASLPGRQTAATLWTGEAPVAQSAESGYGLQQHPGIQQNIRMTTILLLTLSNIFMTFAWQ